MKKKPEKSRRPAGIRAEYDFSKGERGKYASKYRRGTHVILLAADLTQYFPDSASVNKALRAYRRMRAAV